jgi:hypothetical protein
MRTMADQSPQTSAVRPCRFLLDRVPALFASHDVPLFISKKLRQSNRIPQEPDTVPIVPSLEAKPDDEKTAIATPTEPAATNFSPETSKTTPSHLGFTEWSLS